MYHVSQLSCNNLNVSHTYTKFRLRSSSSRLSSLHSLCICVGEQPVTQTFFWCMLEGATTQSELSYPLFLMPSFIYIHHNCSQFYLPHRHQIYRYSSSLYCYLDVCDDRSVVTRWSEILCQTFKILIFYICNSLFSYNYSFFYYSC